MSREYTVTLRALVPAAAATLPTEACGMDIWVSRTTRCARSNIIGVSARQIDVLHQVDLTDDDTDLVVEIGKKRGKYDHVERTRITLRRALPSLLPETVPADQLTVRYDGDECIVSLIAGDDTLWATRATAYHTQVRDVDGLHRVVWWHAGRYYRHLDDSAVQAVCDDIDLTDAPETITAANRRASRALYQASRDAGWAKLTRRERERLGLGADSPQWHRESDIALARARLAGYGHPTGASEHSLRAARGGAACE